MSKFEFLEKGIENVLYIHNPRKYRVTYKSGRVKGFSVMGCVPQEVLDFINHSWDRYVDGDKSAIVKFERKKDILYR